MDQATQLERLRAAALILLVQKGVAETTTRELAAMAGVAEGPIYRHYKSKDDLVREFFEDHYFRFGGELDRIRGETTGGFSAKLGAMTAFMASLYDCYPTLLSLPAAGAAHCTPEYREGTAGEPCLGFPPAGRRCDRSWRDPAAERDAFRGDADRRHHSAGAGSDPRDSRGTHDRARPEIVARGLALLERPAALSETKEGDQR